MVRFNLNLNSMNWQVKINYICVENSLPQTTPLSVVERIITDSISKVLFPKPDSDIKYNGYNYRLSSIEIIPTNDKIII